VRQIAKKYPMSETDLVQRIRLALGRGAIRIFRNNRGKLKDERGRWVSFGIGDPGGADLLGWQTVTITPDMIGQKFARFISVEVKKVGARTDKQRAIDQANWRTQVNAAGGIAIEARSVSEVEEALSR
jgi:hypothetical protein